jgi:orotidine-5'-phosphate decarboxylase
MTTYLDRLAKRSVAVQTVLCVGVDPDPDRLPDGFSRDLDGIERFATILVEATMPYAAAVKPNLAFFEAFGAAGLAVLERLRKRLPADLPVVADAKRGDINSTVARQAVALFDVLGADAVTVSPYVGSEGLEPFLDRPDRFAYVLCRTSNPGAAELQGLAVEADTAMGAPAEPLYLRVARRAATWGPGGTVGLVVGATAPAELLQIRNAVPDLPFLVPGLGTQGGDADAVLRHGPVQTANGNARPGGSLLVNVSRSLAGAALGPSSGPGAGTLEAGLAAAARDWAARLPVLP